MFPTSSAPCAAASPAVTSPDPDLVLRVSRMKAAEMRAIIFEHLPERDEESEWYRPSDLAPLVGIDARNVTFHLRALFPKHEGEWRLSRAEAERVISRIVFAGRKVQQAVIALLSPPTVPPTALA